MSFTESRKGGGVTGEMVQEPGGKSTAWDRAKLGAGQGEGVVKFQAVGHRAEHI